MMNIEFRPLSVNDGRDVYDMLQEIPKDENGYMNGVNGRTYDEYRAWLARAEEVARMTDIVDGWMVPQSTYFLLADGRPVAVGKLRHFLTDKLREAGGHIGYAVRPGERGKGYGTILLRELIRVCGEKGIDRALITVLNDNVASIRVALKNGGVIEKVDDTRHFIWINCV